MKNFNFLRLAVVFAFLGILFGSCTKDSLSKPQTIVQSSQHSTNDPGPVANRGVILAKLFSSSTPTMSLTAYGEDGFISEEIFADENGNVKIEDLLEGTYTIVAHAYIYSGTDDLNFTDATITIDNVQVIADQVTDLGTISFD